MSGWRDKMTPEDVRDALRRDSLNDDEKAYFGEVFNQMDGIDFKSFLHACGASIYELARTMGECQINALFVTNSRP